MRNLFFAAFALIVSAALVLPVRGQDITPPPRDFRPPVQTNSANAFMHGFWMECAGSAWPSGLLTLPMKVVHAKRLGGCRCRRSPPSVFDHGSSLPCRRHTWGWAANRAVYYFGA